ncbi:MAG TPA: hypothetical protein VNA11_10355, partial [Pseudonocardia sp.]|nr:hypothetical protein [Pseudonocardia sp.]
SGAGSHNPATWPAWRRLLPLVMAATDPARPLDPVAGEVGWLLSQAAGYLRARGQPRVAQALDEDAHALYLRHLGVEHRDTRAGTDRLAADLSHPLQHSALRTRLTRPGDEPASGVGTQNGGLG